MYETTRTGDSVNDAETRALFQATRKTVWYRSILQSLNVPQPIPTPNFEDNKVTIVKTEAIKVIFFIPIV